MDKLITIFKVPELRRKILFTCLLLAIYRIGFYVPLPIVNQSQLKNWEEQQSGNTAGKLFGTVAMFGGTSIGMSTIFGLGIMPYISASIIFQLLASVVPSLEAMMKEGESGRKRINEYTRYATVVLCAIQSAFWVQYMMSPQMNVVLQRYHTFWNGFVCVCIMTAGTIFLMWIGEQIDEYGIGNGISLLIMAGILARLPVAITGPNGLWYNATSKLNAEPGKYGITTILLLIGLFIAVVVGVIAITESQRRIPTQSAKHVRGRRVYGGTKQFLPLKVNQAGVMPIIFASSLLIFPSFVFSSLERATTQLAVRSLDDRVILRGTFPRPGVRLSAAELHLHRLLRDLDLLLLLFLDGDHLQPQGHGREPQGPGQLHSGLPARRPDGRLPRKGHAADHLRRGGIPRAGRGDSVARAIGPGVDWTVASFLGGTGLLIVISVCLDLVQKIDGHLVVRSYSGLVTRK